MIRFFSVIVFFLVITAIKTTLTWPTLGPLAAICTVPYFVVMLGWQFAYRARPHVAETMWFRILAWSGSLSMGLWATYFLLTLPVDFLWIGARLVHLVRPAAFSASLVTFSQAYQALLWVAAVITLIGHYQALRGPRLTHVRIPIRNLSPALEGLKIVQISDLHIGATIRTAYVERVVRRANSANGDIVAVTGDLADANAASIENQLRPLAGLRSRLGTFFVTGNHEYFWDVESLLARVRQLGFRPLLNGNETVGEEGGRILVAGVTDPMGELVSEEHRPDMARASAFSGGAALKVLLAHQPNVFAEAAAAGFDLQLSGHTHGGQFFPFNLITPLVHRFNRGLHRHGGLWVHVNPGTGYWGPAHRFGIASEITVLTLTNGSNRP